MSEVQTKSSIKQFLNFPFFVGLRYIGSARLNLFVSFVSLSSAIGLALGVAVLILVLSVMNGFEHELHHRILGMVSHVVVESPDRSVQDAQDSIETGSDWQKIMADVQEQSGVQAAAPAIIVNGMLTHQGDMVGIELVGVDPGLEKKVSIFSDYMVVGESNLLQPGQNKIIIGSLIASRLNLITGDWVTFVYPEPSGNSVGVVPKFHRFNVAGVFQVGSEYDGLVSVIHIEDASVMTEMGSNISSIRIRLDDIFKAPEIASQIKKIIPENYHVSDWTITQGGFFQAVAMEKVLMGFLLMLIVAVAAFNIISSLVMMVSDKNMDIAVLRTLGATPGQVTMIFVIQGLFVGFIGVLVGTILGVLSSVYIDRVLQFVELLFNTRLFDAYFIDYLPTKLEFKDVILISISSLLLSFLATIYPALKASEIKPAEALRYE